MNINNIGSGVSNDTAYKPEIQMPKQVEQVHVAQQGGVKATDSLTISSKKGAEQVYGMPGQKKDDEELMEQGIKQANKSLESSNRYIEREVHEKTHAVMYKLKDSVTGEVIAEFPPKKIQDMVAKMWELAGLFVDEKA